VRTSLPRVNQDESLSSGSSRHTSRPTALSAGGKPVDRGKNGRKTNWYTTFRTQWSHLTGGSAAHRGLSKLPQAPDEMGTSNALARAGGSGQARVGPKAAVISDRTFKGTTVDIKSIRDIAFAMPLTSPALPMGPYRFVNREFFIISYRTDPE